MRNYLIISLSCTLLLLSGFARAEVLLAADMNRDGVVEFATDTAGESSTERALVLFNNDDDDGDGAPDHEDDVVNGDDDLEDMATILVQPVAPSELKQFITDVELAVNINEEARPYVRLFHRLKTGEIEALDLTPQDNGIDGALLPFSFKPTTLYLEARTFAGPDWNGEIDVTATFYYNEFEDNATVGLRVAPFILLSNAARGETVYVREFPERNDALLDQLRRIVPAAGADLHIIPAGDPYAYNHIWLQDTMEIGLSEIPGKRMNVVLKGNRNKSLDEFSRRSLLGPDFGWFKWGEFRPEYASGESGDQWLDWYGNLEVSPPVAGFPLGRVYYGYNPASGPEASLNPEIVAMLDAQGVQGPALPIDVGWLLIKHADEVLCFVPSGDAAHPWRVLVPSTALGIELLEAWRAEGRGAAPLLDIFEDGLTVDGLLAREELVANNRELQARLDAIYASICKEFGLRGEDLLRIPAIMNLNGTSLIPNMVNALVLNGHLVMAAPNGPRDDDGVDLLERFVRETLGDLPLEIHFVDDRQYHKWSGNVHCATNARRSGFESPWWTIRPTN